MIHLYFFDDARDYRFARAMPKRAFSRRCPECGSPGVERVSPLIVEWQPDSAIIGDFTPVGLIDLWIVAQRVRDVLEKEFRGLEFGPVDMYQDPKLKRPERSTKKTRPRVWLPYEGPPLWQIIPTSWCDLDLEKSGIVLLKVCSTCGRRSHQSPAPGRRSLVIDPSSWHGEGIFRVREYSRLIYCTEDVKLAIQSHGFTNVAFELDGGIPDRDASQRFVAVAPAWVDLAQEPTTGDASRAVERPDVDCGSGYIGSEPARSTMASPPAPSESGLGIPAYDEMPEDNEDLGRIQVSFPYLPENSAESCPVPVDEIIEYLAVEAPGGEALDAGDFEFLRTAQVAERSFWIWRFTDSGGAECYVTVDVSPDSSTSIGYDENYYHLSPEQFMLGVYHQVF